MSAITQQFISPTKATMSGVLGHPECGASTGSMCCDGEHLPGFPYPGGTAMSAHRLDGLLGRVVRVWNMQHSSVFVEGRVVAHSSEQPVVFVETACECGRRSIVGHVTSLPIDVQRVEWDSMTEYTVPLPAEQRRESCGRGICCKLDGHEGACGT